jgi:tellurite resistance protein TerA
MNQVLLQAGGNVSISNFSGTVIISHDIDARHDINLTAFLLTESGRVQGDSGIVFFNQPRDPNGAATFIAPTQSGNTKTHRIDFDLRKIPAGINKIAVTLTEDNCHTFATVKNLKAEIRVANQVVQLVPNGFNSENGIIVSELYIRNEQPKVKAIWQGFASGLDGLCQYYGVQVEENAKPPLPPVTKSSFVNLQKVSGKVQLDKNSKAVMIEKTPEISASISWRTGTDYDVYALVYTRDDKQIDVATFGANGVSQLINFDNGAVQHLGDVGRGGGKIKTETIKIRLNDNIVAVVPVAYSAQSNGTGSFKRYKVSMLIDNHQGTAVTVTADNANQNDTIYTCVPGMILNTHEGVIIKPLELYSEPDSENRPKLVKENGQIKVIMDAGPINNYK